ncbi:MlaD family protein [Paraconexibacter algicola]|uniref:Mce/MlaD domain-containing protein n=1 Tax=Paraconexibacter algicola TaxID=2133960 RepID=A0A2T4UL58_9ACTN|nr:MlaD family protein [Paraconexibacter algicola]PTL59945.1 hypothetical protein C7Y72_09960 [Paraconexibacter algicola]
MSANVRFSLAAVLVVVAAVVLVSRGTDSPADYRVDVVFDTAKGMVPGQLVKVAGTKVGEVREVKLTPERRARVTLEVERRFAPFRQDATCRILPEGLISEYFVDCQPGRKTSPPLEDDVLPVTRTSVPVSLQDVIDVFSLPVDQRIRALVTELGIATSGRGQDLNAILRRANPALQNVRDMLAVLDAQRTTLASAISQTDGVLAEVARDERSVRRFVTSAADVTETTGTRDRALRRSINRLPALLDRARTGLTDLDETAMATTPLLDGLREAAPELERFTRTLPAFAEAGDSTLRTLSPTLRSGRRALRSANPDVLRLRRTLRTVEPSADLLSRFLVDLRNRGGIERVLNVTYTLAALTAGRDELSHMLSFFINVAPQCIVAPTTSGCSHKYTAPQQGAVPVNTGPAPVTRGTAIDLLRRLGG